MFSPEQIREIIRLYLDHSTYEIAVIFHSYPKKIREILLESGVKLRTPSEAQSLALKKGRSKNPFKGRSWSEIERKRISEQRKKKKEN